MRCYTLGEPGIRLGKDGMIHVGEAGRGRRLVTVPLPAGAVVKDGILLECSGPATSALVLLPDQSGFRGSWHLRNAMSKAAWDEYLEATSREERETIVRRCKLPAAVYVIAEGRRAQGDAGYVGGGPELLVIMSHEQAIELVRSGRLYGDPSVIRLDCQAGLVTASFPRADAESRRAARRFAAAGSEEEGAVETVLCWGGGTTQQLTVSEHVRPHLIGPDGTVYVFNGESIPEIVNVFFDESQRSGPQSGRYTAYRVVLFPGVSLRGYEIPVQ